MFNKDILQEYPDIHILLSLAEAATAKLASVKHYHLSN